MHVALPKPLVMTGARPVSLRRLASFCELSAAEEALIKRLKPRTHPSGYVLSDAAESASWMILSGWCARARTLPDGRRQIVQLLLPGDAVGVKTGSWAGDRLQVITLTPVIAADAAPLQAALDAGGEEHAGLSRACDRAVWCDQVYCLNAIVRLGQQSAYERLAHLMLEIHSRLDAVGLASEGRFQLPVTQDVIAHTLGLSLVHLSRTLRQMRKEESILVRTGQAQILRPDVLSAAANFPHVATWQH